MSVIEILEAGTEDVPDLCNLLRHLYEQEVEFVPNKTSQTAGLLQIINDKSRGTILVLKKDGRIIGMVNLLFTISTALGGVVAILEDMVISPSERGYGYGSKLLTSAVDHAKNNQCKRITLLTDSTNNRAHKFYENHGFSHSSMVVFRKLLNN